MVPRNPARSNRGAARAIRLRVTRVVLPLAAVIVLGLGVYLFIAVRAQPVEPAVIAARPAATRAEPPPAADDAPGPAAVREATPPREAAPPREATPPPAAPTASAAPAPSELPDAKLDAVMAEANKAYDRGDYDDAKIIAGRVLRDQPSNVRMLRIMVSASCQDGDVAVAQAHYVKLPPGDQAQMRTRCARFGVQLAALDRP